MKKQFRSILYTALAMCVAAGCSTAGQVSSSSRAAASSAPVSSQDVSSAAVPAGSAASSAQVSSAASVADALQAASWAVAAPQTVQNMTLEQKVGQLFFLCFRHDTDGTNLYTYNNVTRKTIKNIQPGGVVLFQENVHTTAQLRRLIQNIQADCTTAPFIGVDQEGGKVQRVSANGSIHATAVPTMWKVGQTGSTSLAQQVGAVLGSELTVFGFNLDFAPDCDVFSNPQNKVIGTRAFSSDPQKVAAFSTAVSAGIRSQGVIPVCKHFPGHGDTSADTHAGYAAVNKTLAQLRQTELVPFKAQAAAGAEMIMVAHISLPKINGDSTPATMSSKVVQGLLRGELGYSGVVITDAMDMGAVAQHYSSGEAAVRAIHAGVDMILMPEDPQAAYTAVLKAVKSGSISQERLNQSVERILALKKKYNLFSKRALGRESLLGCSEHQQVVAQVG
ncbi:MAG: beta-N-acetylhexosaminidase [Oscillospiraceae bacterium]|nr:beta-N-acetylhexosaminidase [Oscillospiraceae bacterium]